MSLHTWLAFAVVALLGATFIVSDALVFAGYGLAAHRARTFLRSPRAARPDLARHRPSRCWAPPRDSPPNADT